MARDPLDDDFSSSPHSSADTPSNTNEGSGSARDGNYEQLIARLLRLAYEEIGQSEGIVERLPQEIQQAAQEGVQLLLTLSHDGIETPSLALHAPSYPVQFSGRMYGNLANMGDPLTPQTPLSRSTRCN